MQTLRDAAEAEKGIRSRLEVMEQEKQKQQDLNTQHMHASTRNLLES
jgi:hypothetical protein